MHSSFTNTVTYELTEAQRSLEFILEQVVYGTEVVVQRDGLEIARITAVEGLRKPATKVMSVPYEQ
ncbi:MULTISPECIES: hypothetical protein [unclassified Pseudomonas]|uniref:hypothetical protein n=1 Tax=unclassified Pseudomonas TaxID=196821 RepID=UPI002248E02F|nr:hypothetical protein [Pseudomonas sp. DCB_BG]MCX2708339.1 hypothetical protein [Pseudomonas sp. DCB_BG]